MGQALESDPGWHCLRVNPAEFAALPESAIAGANVVRD
jgi:hypothetical protein